MGEFYFETKSNVLMIVLQAAISILVLVGTCACLFSVWSATEWGWHAIYGGIALLALGYTLTRIFAFKNKIAFYEQGMIITKGLKTKTLMLVDIIKTTSVQSTGSFGITTSFKMNIATENGLITTLGSNDYSKLASSFGKYGNLINYNFRTNFN